MPEPQARSPGLTATIRDLEIKITNAVLSADKIAQMKLVDPTPYATNYHEIIRRQLAIPKDQIVVCGMALGYED